jgi:hypothetical protein
VSGTDRLVVRRQSMGGEWAHDVMDANRDWHVVVAVAVAAALTLHWVIVGLVIAAMFPARGARRGRSVGVTERSRCGTTAVGAECVEAGQERIL